MAPETISRYRIIRELGRGGMGAVYLAHDPLLDRDVALKLLPHDVAHDPERLRRFRREARAAAAVIHPGVAHVYEIGRAGNTHFIAMEYVRGESLSERIRGAPLETHDILSIGIQIADALDEAHRNGITHRDVKPGNIMLTGRGQVKVLDFGLARLTPGGDEPTAIQTAFGLVMGTLQYMSPEQAKAGATDHRTDIFSLGVVLYEMATGRRPFAGATPIETTNLIAQADPPPIGRINPRIPPELERLIRKCLEKAPERRYQSAREIVIDLESLMRQPAQAGKPGAGTTRRPPSRHAVKSLAVLPLTNESTDPGAEYLSDGITESIINNLSQLPGLRVIAMNAVRRFRSRDLDGRAENVRSM